MSVFWFERTCHIVPNHLLAWRVDDLPEPLRFLHPTALLKPQR
jgi:phosphoribosylaminoimidazole-succinocarboxamide synthase